MKQRNDLKDKEKLLLVGVFLVIIVLIGSTYAFFRYSKTSDTYILTSGKIKVEFEGGTNSIEFKDAYPLTDSFAINNLDKLSYIDFQITNTASDNQEINYEIYLTDENSTLDTNYIKVYLTDDTKEQISGPINYGTLSLTSYKNSNGRVVFKDTVSGNFSQKYRLYVWLDYTYKQNDKKEECNFKVNLYAYNAN